MLGFNWVDAIIVVLLGLAVVEGVRIGVLSQLFFIAGFFVVLFLAGSLFPHIVRFHDPAARTLVNVILVLLAASYAAVRSLDAAQKIHWSFRLGKLSNGRKLKLAETVLGALPGLVAGIVVVWLLAVMLGRLPFAGLSNSVNDARIVQTLSLKLPPVPAVFAEFNRQIDPTAQPYVYVQPKPQPMFDYSAVDVSQAAANAESSIVRITSFDCGGLVGGSGFVVAPGIVATNAHVIAGAKRPIIKYRGQSYEGIPIYLDAGLDLAMLRVPGLDAPPLTLAPQNVSLNTTVAILGYPGGNYRVEPGIIRDTRSVDAANIYNQGIFGRGIYVLQAHVDYGNSGGPVVMQDGTVVGIVFSRSLEVSDEAYALTSVHIDHALERVKTSHTRIGTGACMLH